MFRYQILIEYVGTNFRGWQVEKKGKTIQGLIQEKISKLLKEKITLLGSGRTDTGVHAIEQSAHFECNNEIKQKGRFLKSMNHFLNKDGISILKIRRRTKSFHARFSAKIRIYKYVIINRLSGPVLDEKRGWHIMKKLDVVAMKKGAKKLLKPGTLLKDYEKEVGKLMEKELVDLGLLSINDIKNYNSTPAYKRYYMHGTSHHLGLDVHDVSGIDQPLSEGMVLTCEPGIYIPEEGVGIRLENDILIGKNQNTDLMENIPIEAEDIEDRLNI